MKRHVDRAIESDQVATTPGQAVSVSGASPSPLSQAIHDSPIQARQRQLIDGINNSPRMQQQRRQFQSVNGAADAPVQLKSGFDQPADAVAQLTPDQAMAMKTLKPELKKKREFIELEQTLANVRRFSQTYSNIAPGSESLLALKAGMRRALDTFLETRYVVPKGTLAPPVAFLKTWNEETPPNSVERYAKSGASVDYTHKAPKAMVGPDKAASYLTEWQAKANSAKTMTPDRKMAAMLPMLLAEPDLPPNLKIALKLFFSHTANFVPEEHQGRDFRAHEHGQYFRSSLTPPRAENSEQLKKDALKMYAESGESAPKGKTYQVINREHHEALRKLGKMGSNIDGMDFIGESTDKALSYAEYASSGGSHTGSLGLIQNVYRTLMVGSKVETGKDGKAFGGKGAETWTPKSTAADLRPVVGEHKLAPSTEQNYHDFLIADRNAAVADAAQAIRDKYGTSETGLRIVPIQSEGHASLILEVQYPEENDENLTEAEWRHTFIQAFNTAAAAEKLETRLTHRGSFGFLHPTASSVGGPIRIWPGLAPRAVFKKLILGALSELPKIEQVTSGLPGAEPRENPLTKLPLPLPVLLPVPTSGATSIRTKARRGAAKKKSSPATTPTLTPTPATASKTAAVHMEGLKSAVRYAQDVMRDTFNVLGPESMVEWVAVRLKKNLTKAEFLLDTHGATDSATEEREYLKASSVIENLMEYSYMLEALQAAGAPAHDPYPDHLRQKLALGSEKTGQKLHTFYLDSGMQAIVAAHLLAREWAEKSKSVKPKQPLRSLDMNTYFEYASIDKTNLLLKAENRMKGAHLDKEQVKDIINPKQPPHIISADLNPVLTAAKAKKNLVSPQHVLSRFVKKGEKNKITIPIIDITNASLKDAADLHLGDGYENFVIVESLSKHHQLGADKYTMGRLNAVGTKDFVKLAEKLVGPIAATAHHALPAAYRLRMDRVFYGEQDDAQWASSFIAGANKYDAFMEAMEKGEAWQRLRKKASGKKDDLLPDYREMKTLLSQALDLFQKQLSAEKNKTKRHADYKRYHLLPLTEQRNLQHLWDEPKALSKKDAAVLPEWFEPEGNGITNVGNTCYLAAALNSIAFSPYFSLFEAQHADPKAALRLMVHGILAKIRASTRVAYDDMAVLLSALDHARLLEGPNAFAAARPLNAQRDPSEVMSYLLTYFGIHGRDYLLAQTGSKTLDRLRRTVPGGDPSRYSDVGADGKYADRTVSDWLIKLPMTGSDGLGPAIARYQAEERIQGLRAVQNGRVIEGGGKSRIAFGGQAPLAVTIQLLRWELTENGIVKQTRPFDMPLKFVLNKFNYALKSIIHHHSDHSEGGHYTANVKTDAGWEHRDDHRVGPENNIQQRRKAGYIYTYEKTTPAAGAKGFRFFRAAGGPRARDPALAAPRGGVSVSPLSGKGSASPTPSPPPSPSSKKEKKDRKAEAKRKRSESSEGSPKPTRTPDPDLADSASSDDKPVRKKGKLEEKKKSGSGDDADDAADSPQKKSKKGMRRRSPRFQSSTRTPEPTPVPESASATPDPRDIKRKRKGRGSPPKPVSILLSPPVDESTSSSEDKPKKKKRKTKGKEKKSPPSDPAEE